MLYESLITKRNECEFFFASAVGRYVCLYICLLLWMYMILYINAIMLEIFLIKLNCMDWHGYLFGEYNDYISLIFNEMLLAID